MSRKVPLNPWLKMGEPRRARTPKAPKADEITEAAETGPFFIRGKRAGSKDEYWVALALDIIQKATGWTWDYQVPLYGGHRLRGGAVVDFLVHTPGSYTMLDPMGRYWHTGKHEDRLQMKMVALDRGWRLVEWFTDATPSKEAVLSFLRKELHA